MNLPYVRKQWNRVVFMQTNREDVGKRYLEIKIPVPVDKDVAESVSKPYNDYFKQLDEINKLLQESLTNLTNKYSL